MMKMMQKNTLKSESKIRSLDELSALRIGWKNNKELVGFTSGSFDILHAGHITYLEKAKKYCNILIVGVNSDKSIKSYKDPKRPINPEKERLIQVAGLSSVDYVFLFNEDNNHNNIRKIKPDCYIKAGDYDMSKLTSKPLVEEYGGRAILIPITINTSTSDIIKRIKNTQ